MHMRRRMRRNRSDLRRIEQAIGSMDDTIKLSTELFLGTGNGWTTLTKVVSVRAEYIPEIFYTTGIDIYRNISEGRKTVVGQFE